MQTQPHYEDVLREVGRFLDERARALVESGIARERIVIDPGLGFGKRWRDNLTLLKGIDSLGKLGYPILVGASRKSFIGTLLAPDAGSTPADDRLAGSLAIAAHCYTAGVEMVRVHDVRETVELFRVLDAIHSFSD
jgi:dihydropteroate synthase